MSKTLAISDAAYSQLAQKAEAQGFTSVEAFLEQWANGSVGSARRETVDRILKLQAEIAAKHGPFPDSTGSIREDRDR